jgi:hypothetical protein
LRYQKRCGVAPAGFFWSGETHSPAVPTALAAPVTARAGMVGSASCGHPAVALEGKVAEIPAGRYSQVSQPTCSSPETTA